MKRKKIIKKIQEAECFVKSINEYNCVEDWQDAQIKLFRLGMKEGVKEYEKETWETIEEACEWSERVRDIIKDKRKTECPMCKEYKDKPCPFCNPEVLLGKSINQTNKSGGHKDNPNFCKCDYKCNRKYLDEFNYFCQDVCIKCEYDIR